MSIFVRKNRIFPSQGSSSGSGSGQATFTDKITIPTALTANSAATITHSLNITDIVFTVRDVNGEDVQCIIKETIADPTNSFDITTFADYLANTVVVTVSGHQ